MIPRALDYSGTDAVLLNDGTIQNSLSDVDANLGIPAPGDTDSLSAEQYSHIAHADVSRLDPTAIPEGYDAISGHPATEAYWRLGSPTGELTAWVNGADAVFGELGTPGAVSIDDGNDPNGPIWASSMTFETGGYSLVGYTECDTLSLASEGTPVEVDNGTATIALPIGEGAYSGGLEKTGNGTLLLDAENTYSGLTKISAGTLQLGDGSVSGWWQGTSRTTPP